MSSKILNAIWTVAVLVFWASLIFIMGISYNYFSNVQKEQLKSETQLAYQGVSLSGADFFTDLDAKNYRITWIDAQGNVLYDNEADRQEMENHLEREEVREALESGYGEAARYSSTLAEKQLYCARRLPDGTVLRLSIVQATVWTLILGFAQPICLVIVIAFVLSFVLASRLAKKIVKPINEINLEHPEYYYGKENYREVEPLLRQINAQRIQLKNDQEQIEKTALIRQEFTANVSHELKTPLHAISGYAELLENGMVAEGDIKPFARKIRTESSRLTKLVEDIIDLTKLDNGGANDKWESCDLFMIAQNAVDSLQTAAADMDVEISIEGKPLTICGVPQHLYSIVYNLCDNAVKYNHHGGRVSVKVESDGTFAVIKIDDTGIGIPEESQERVFERFYRVDKSRSKEVGGTGLGLSIVKHAVLVHEGSIEMTSQVGEGTHFEVRIPIKRT
ncbi:MAG: PAS domain-containing sensor histidine kinase [Lachnospiraceae bacterium]|nr:PAS domain-containing sensor histidine kinase [Lachnospiraceae bacterium]